MYLLLMEDGNNDVFHVTAGGVKEYSIEIFNRWGERVFISSSAEIDWDGRSPGSALKNLTGLITT